MQPRQRELPKIPTTVQNAGAIVCAAALALLGYMAVHQPLRSWLSSVESDMLQVQAKLKQGPALRRQHAEQQRLHEQLLQRVELVNSRIPDQPREGEFLADVSRLAGEHGVVIQDFRRGSTVETPTHSVVSVTLTARSSHGGLCGLIDAIAGLPRLAELRSLDIRPNGDSEARPVTLTYDLYYGMSTGAPTAASG